MNPPPPLLANLLNHSPHSSPNPLALSLFQSFSNVQSQLSPPFPLSIPSPTQYTHLNLALIYATLTQRTRTRTHLTHLHAIVTDSFSLFTSTLTSLSTQLYPHLLPIPRSQLLILTAHLVSVSAAKVDALLFSLLRQLTAGDFSDHNLLLAKNLLNILACNWDWLLEEQPLVLPSSVFVFLRLLSDHYRIAGRSPILDELKRLEVEFCVKALRECFGLCMKIGRDLIRLLQDLVYVPEFKEIWKDLLFDPAKFHVHEFIDIAQLYKMRTSSHYFLLRISPEMETWLKFLLSRVKFGSQKRYQAWFCKKYLNSPASETLVVDVVRFICCGHHPSNEVLQSDVITRWAVVGWLLKCCRKNYYEANVKLALFYDWLFFDEKVDTIMNIEPAMLLMVHSLPQYVDMTQTLMEFLFLLVDNYDVRRKEMIFKGVTASFQILMKKGVVHSMDPIISCSLISPALTERLRTLISVSNPGTSVKSSSDICYRQFQQAHLADCHIEVNK